VVPPEVAEFGREAAARLQRVLADDLVGVYFIGSVALGDYVPGHSDIDMVAVTDRAVSDDEKRKVAGELSHPNLPCPTRGFEFVLYARPRVAIASSDAAFEINLNTGPRMAPHVGFDASAEPRFWFVIDRAIAHASGISIDGPPAREVFASVPRPVVLEAMAESIAWHRAHEPLGHFSVLNACRAWRYAEAGELGSKADAAEWARERSADAETIDTALRMRRGARAELPELRIAAVLDRARAALKAALADTDGRSARIYHLAIASEWEAAVAAGGPYDRSTVGVSLAEQGFIHCSFAEQVEATAAFFYADRDDVLLLTIDPSALGAEVRVEDGFPHLYGPLPLVAVVSAAPFE
jgi:uncharacterized protein (DUF952 family)